MNKPYIPKVGERVRIVDVSEKSAWHFRRGELIGQIVECTEEVEINQEDKDYIVLAWNGKIGSFSRGVRVEPLSKNRQSKLIEE